MATIAARLPPLSLAAPAAEAAVPLYTEGELAIATAMTEQGYWHAYCRNREELSPTFCGTQDIRARLVADIAADIKLTVGKRQPGDYLIFLIPHNHFFSAQRADEDLPYFSRPFDPAFAEVEAHNAAMFAHAERNKGRRKVLPEFTTPEARQIENLLAEIPPGPLREVMVEVSEKLLHRAEAE